MIVVKSSATGQVLFALEMMHCEIAVGSQEARSLIETLAKSGLGHLVQMTQNGSGFPVPVACMHGVMATRHALVDLDDDAPLPEPEVRRLWTPMPRKVPTN